MQTTNNVPVDKVIKISHVPAAYRTLDETTAYANFLSNFEFFKSKVLDNSLDEVLNLATKHLKYSRIPAGQFLYHHGQSSNCIYLVLKGEAWKFRQKTEQEVELDHLLKQKKANSKEIPKILETIALAKAQMARNKVQLPVPTAVKPSAPNGSDKSPLFPDTNRTPRRNRDFQVETKQGEASIHVKEEGKAENKVDVDSAKLNQNMKVNILNNVPGTRKIGESLLKKLKDTKNVLNFENDYLLNLIKRNAELTTRYMKDKNCLLKFEKKYGSYDTLGEMSMSLNQIRTSSVLAYTELHVFYLDQKSYEKVFFAQIEEIKEKLDFFSEYFKEINFNNLKKLCFLFTERKFKLGELLYKEGSPCDNLYFIKSGEVQLVKKLTVEDGFHSCQATETDLNVHNSHKMEKNVLVASVRDGHFCGEEVLSGEPVRNFTAKSMSYLTCYVVSPQVLSRLPEKIIRNLQEMSMPKQNWRGNRLEDIKNQPLFKNIQKNLTLTTLSRERTKGGSRTDSIGTDNSLEKSTSQEHRSNTERFITPRRKVDLSSTEYGFFQNKKNQGIQNTHTINIVKAEETQSPYKLSVRKLSIEKRNSFIERNLASSRSRRKTRLMIDQENQKTLESIKYSLHPSSSRSQRKKSEKTFEIRSGSESDDSEEQNNPSFDVLQANDSSDMSDEGFEYNFITKLSKRKKTPPAEKKDVTLSRDRSKGLSTVNRNPVKNQENQRETSPRVIYTPKSQALTEANYKKLKGSLLNLMSREKSNYYYQNSRAEIESANYFTIKAMNSQQGAGFSSLKYLEDSKGLSPKSISFSKAETSLSPKHKNLNVVIKDRSQLLHVQGSKVRGVF